MNRLLPPACRALGAALALLLSACGGGGTKLDTAALAAPFAAAAPALKSQADAAVKALKGGDHLAGVKALGALAKEHARLSEEQRAAMIDATAQVQTRLAEQPTANDMAVHQAIEDMMAALEGRPAKKVGEVGRPTDAAPE
ncbi:MAG: hypothetical protein ACKVYV_05320 [Limisphaerales bacterium]